MTGREKDKQSKNEESLDHSRRDFLKVGGAVAGGLAAGAVPGLVDPDTASAQQQGTTERPPTGPDWEQWAEMITLSDEDRDRTFREMFQ